MTIREREAPTAWPATHLVPFDGSCSIGDFPTGPPEGVERERELEHRIEKCVAELYELQRVLYADGRHAVLVVFQAMDAAGKDSTIRHVFSGVNPHGFRVNAFGPPSDLERKHDFLWRCQACLPERGRIGIFNRSHYEEVLVVRVHPEFLRGQNLPDVDFDRVWSTRFQSIRDWERHLAANGTTIVKFWLNVSRDEQRRRFLKRIEREDKNWKFRLGDVEARERWDDYQCAYEDVLRESSREWAPWYAIPADDKPYMRLAVARTMVETLRGLDVAYPKLTDDQRRDLEQGRRRLESESARGESGSAGTESERF